MSESSKTYSNFFLLWFPIVSISTYIGVLLSSPIGTFLFRLRRHSYSTGDDGDLETTLSFLLLVALFLSFGQWLVINTRIKKAQYWIPATIIGFLVGSIVYLFIFVYLLIFLEVNYVQVAGFMMLGIFAGICQCASLKKKFSIWIKWSLVTGLSLSIGYLLMLMVSNYTKELTISSALFSGAVGLISGIYAKPLIILSENGNTNQQKVASYR